MAYIKLPYNEKLDIPKSTAEKIKAAIEAEQDGDTPIAVSPTRTIKLRQVKDVDTEGSAEGVDRTKGERYDLDRDRELLLKFTNLVESHGGFEGYCRDNQLTLPSEGGCGWAMNVEKHAQFTEASELWTACKKLKDILHPMTMAEKIAKLDEMRSMLKEKMGMFRVKSV